MEYKTTAKLVIQACDKDLPGVFGHGCVLLLQGIAREHSLNRAAKSMGMAYSKAWRIVNEAEGQLGCKLIERDGARGSTLTPAGERAIAVYEELQADINNVIATKASDLKQMRFGLKIGSGDLDVKLRKVRGFLADGHKVRLQVVYKGREMAHKEIGYELIEKITGLLENEAIVEQKPQMAGRNLSVVIRSK